MVSLMSREAADDLGLAPGVAAVASVKATNVTVELSAQLASLVSNSLADGQSPAWAAQVRSDGAASCDLRAPRYSGELRAAPCTGTGRCGPGCRDPVGRRASPGRPRS